MIFFLPSPWNGAAPHPFNSSYSPFISHLYQCFILPLNDRRWFFCAVDSLVANGCSRTPNSKKEAITSKYKWLNQLEELQKQMHLFADSLARKCLTKFTFKQNFFSTMCFSSFYFSGWSCAFLTYIHVLWISSVSLTGAIIQSVSIGRQEPNGLLIQVKNLVTQAWTHLSGLGSQIKITHIWLHSCKPHVCSRYWLHLPSDIYTTAAECGGFPTFAVWGAASKGLPCIRGSRRSGPGHGADGGATSQSLFCKLGDISWSVSLMELARSA